MEATSTAASTAASPAAVGTVSVRAKVPWVSGTWLNKDGHAYAINSAGVVSYRGKPWATLYGAAPGSRHDVEIEEIRGEGRRNEGLLRGSGRRIVWDDGDGWFVVDRASPRTFNAVAPLVGPLAGTFSPGPLLSQPVATARTPSVPVPIRRRGPGRGDSARGAGIRVGDEVLITSFTCTDRKAEVLAVESDGRYRLRVSASPAGGRRPREVLASGDNIRQQLSQRLARDAASNESKNPGAYTCVAQVENRNYTHAFVRGSGIGITHSGILVQTLVGGEVIRETVVDLIEFKGKPFVATRQYRRPYKIDNWNDETLDAVFYRRGTYDKCEKPWTHTVLDERPLCFRVWSSKEPDTKDAAQTHTFWVENIQGSMREASRGEFRLFSRNCQHAAAYTLNKLKSEVGIIDDRHAVPPNWLFRFFASESSYIPQPVRSRPSVDATASVSSVDPPPLPAETSPSEPPPEPPKRVAQIVDASRSAADALAQQRRGEDAQAVIEDHGEEEGSERGGAQEQVGGGEERGKEEAAKDGGGDECQGYEQGPIGQGIAVPNPTRLPAE